MDSIKDTLAEARLIYGLCIGPPSGRDLVYDQIFANVEPDDFVYFGRCYASLAATWRESGLAAPKKRAHALARAVKTETPPHEGYWRMLDAASKWPCEFTLHEDASILRLLRIRRAEWLLTLHLQSIVKNDRRNPGRVLLESRNRHDAIAGLFNQSDEVLKWLPPRRSQL